MRTVAPACWRVLLVIPIVTCAATTQHGDALSASLSQLHFPMLGAPITQRTNLSFRTRCGGLPQTSSCGNGGKHWGDSNSSGAAALTSDGPTDRLQPGDCYQTLANGSLAAPPQGLRSAAALGGLGTGSFAMHADGSFHEWTVEHARVSTATHWNKTAANPARVFLLGDAFAGLHVSGSGGHEALPFASAFRTEPPVGVPPADGLSYSSASPVTRLELLDSKLVGVTATLFAHYRWTMGDSNKSSTPAVTFTLQITNNRKAAVNASLLVSMPFAANEGYSRSGQSANETATGCGSPIDPGSCSAPPPVPQPTQVHAGVMSAGACQRLCVLDGEWSSWTFAALSPQFKASGGTCTLQAGRPPQPSRKATNLCAPQSNGAGCGLMEGVTSGLAGRWSVNPTRGLTHSRQGSWDASGGLTLRAVSNGTVQTSYSTGETPADVWQQFTSGVGGVLTPAVDPASHGNGAAAATVALQPGETRTISVVLAWYLPHALYTGEPLGVWYANNHVSSEEVAETVVDQIDQQLHDAIAWNHLIVNTSLPSWLAALLVNTPATEMESGFWTADGRYRQYDNIYAPDESVHVHMFSMIPFVSFQIATTKDIIKTCQARLQCPQDSKDPACPPGMIQEVCGNAGWGNLGCGNSTQNWCGFSVGMMDSGGGRIMGDATSIFILETLQVWKQAPDQDWLASIWSALMAAVHWEVDRSKGMGLPEDVCTTYDYLEIARSPGQVSAYSSFLYLVSLRAAATLAHAMASSDPTGSAGLLKTIAAAEPAAVVAIDQYLWVGSKGTSLGHYKAMAASPGGKWPAGDGPSDDPLMSDSLHGNMWSMILGFGPITNQSRLTSHFAEEYKRNCAMSNTVGCLGIAHFPKIGRHGSQDVSPSFSMDLTANLFFSKAWSAKSFISGTGPTTPAEVVTRGYMDGLHADFFNWRDMSFGPAGWSPESYT